MRRRGLWVSVVCVSLAVLAAGAVAWGMLLWNERALRAAHLVPPHRGATTTLAGMAIGVGLGGLIIGVAALMPTRK